MTRKITAADGAAAIAMLDAEKTAIKDATPPVTRTPAKARTSKAAPKPKATVAPKTATKVEDLSGIPTCGAKGCTKKAVHPLDWKGGDEAVVNAHRVAYHAGTFRASLSGFRKLEALRAEGKPVEYGKRGESKPKDATPKSAGSSAKTAGTKSKRVPKNSGGAVRKSTPPVPEMHVAPTPRNTPAKATEAKAVAAA